MTARYLTQVRATLTRWCEPPHIKAQLASIVMYPRTIVIETNFDPMNSPGIDDWIQARKRDRSKLILTIYLGRIPYQYLVTVMSSRTEGRVSTAWTCSIKLRRVRAMIGRT